MIEHEKLLSRLIETKSLSGQEGELRGLIQNWFKERRIDAFVQGENLAVHFAGRDQSRAFVFNSHMDTVKPGDASWKYGPWTPTKEGDKLYGLGASDMKAGLSATMLLAERMVHLRMPPVDVWFTYVTKEEEDGSGTEKFADWFFKGGQAGKYKEIAGIFTEPTSLTEVEYAHRGNYFLQVTAKGPSGHASRPWEVNGILAVRKMIKFADRFQKAVKVWTEKFPNEHFSHAISVGEMTSIMANVNGIETMNEKGEKVIKVVPGSVNKFPDTCVATFDFRTTPDTHDLLYDRVQELGRRSGVEVALLYPPAPAGFTDPGDKLVQVAQNTLGNRKLVTSLASADLGFLSAKGVKAVIMGPGERSQCHVTDEFCYPDQIPQAVDIYQAIVAAWAK